MGEGKGPVHRRPRQGATLDFGLKQPFVRLLLSQSVNQSASQPAYPVIRWTGRIVMRWGCTLPVGWQAAQAQSGSSSLVIGQALYGQCASITLVFSFFLVSVFPPSPDLDAVGC